MSKWVPTWSYVAMDYGTVVATYEDVSQRCLLRNNLNGTALRLRFNNLYSEAPLTIRHAAVETVHRVTGKRGQRREVTLDGQTKIVIPVDSRPWSDPLPCEITAEEDLRIWLYFEERCAVPSICMTSAARSWIRSLTFPLPNADALQADADRLHQDFLRLPLRDARDDQRRGQDQRQHGNAAFFHFRYPSMMDAQAS